MALPTLTPPTSSTRAGGGPTPPRRMVTGRPWATPPKRSDWYGAAIGKAFRTSPTFRGARTANWRPSRKKAAYELPRGRPRSAASVLPVGVPSGGSGHQMAGGRGEQSGPPAGPADEREVTGPVAAGSHRGQ